MYSCADIVYGYDLSLEGSIHGSYSKDILEYLREYEPSGFINPYSGSSNPYAFGVILDGFDECQNILLSSLKITLTDENKEELNRLLFKLDEDISNKIRKIGEPQLFILWSTS